MGEEGNHLLVTFIPSAEAVQGTMVPLARPYQLSGAMAPLHGRLWTAACGLATTYKQPASLSQVCVISARLLYSNSGKYSRPLPVSKHYMWGWRGSS